jgi:CBS domain-containing protein
MAKQRSREAMNAGSDTEPPSHAITQRGPVIDHVRVGDCMHAGIISCLPDTSLAEVARMMAHHRVHAIAVADLDHGRPFGLWGVVTDMDVMAAVANGRNHTAGDVAATEGIKISAREPLDHAARTMEEHGVAHLVVVDPASSYPVGIISTLDIAAAYGGWRDPSQPSR